MGLGLIHPIHWKRADLKELAEDSLSFYVGSGLSAASGLVTWGELAQVMDDCRVRCEGRKSALQDNWTADALSAFMQAFLNDPISDSTDSPLALSRDAIEHGDDAWQQAERRTILLNCFLRNTYSDLYPDGFKYGEYEKVIKVPTGEPRLEHQKALWNCDPKAVLTTNYDVLIENGYHQVLEPSKLRCYRYTAQFLPFIMTNERFILKLHGDINDVGTMQFDPNSAWKSKRALGGRAGDDVRKVYEKVMFNGHMIYVGAGMRDWTIIELHKAWRIASAKKNDKRLNSLRRFVILPKDEIKAISNKPAGRFARTSLFDDLQFLWYDPEKEDRENTILEFLGKIAEKRQDPD